MLELRGKGGGCDRAQAIQGGLGQPLGYSGPLWNDKLDKPSSVLTGGRQGKPTSVEHVGAARGGLTEGCRLVSAMLRAAPSP